MKTEKQSVIKNSYRYFLNYTCEYYPCHESDIEDFNCLFCYCPMYRLDCLGSPGYISLPDGRTVKDCSGCDFPHRPENYDTIVEYLRMIATGEAG